MLKGAPFHFVTLVFCAFVAIHLYKLVVQSPSCVWLCNPMDCSMPDLLVPYHLPEFAQVHVHCTGDALQPSHPLTPSSPSALDISQHQGLFQWVVCSHQMTKILELQLQHQSFSSKYSGLISLKSDWFDLAVWGTFGSLLQHHSSKASILWHSAFFWNIPYKYYIWSIIS